MRFQRIIFHFCFLKQFPCLSLQAPSLPFVFGQRYSRLTGITNPPTIIVSQRFSPYRSVNVLQVQQLFCPFQRRTWREKPANEHEQNRRTEQQRQRLLNLFNTPSLFHKNGLGNLLKNNNWVHFRVCTMLLFVPCKSLKCLILKEYIVLPEDIFPFLFSSTPVSPCSV